MAKKAGKSPTVGPAPVAMAKEPAAAEDQTGVEKAGVETTLATCFFTTFKSGLDSPPFECTQDMTCARSCLNGENPEDDILMILMI